MIYQSWVGRTIANRYTLDNLLGAGGMSAVYRAYDPNLRRIVAVKLIHPHLSVNPNFVDRFKEEAAAVASLRHPNIVQVFDFNNDGDTYYMVMEYLAGETLQDYLRRINLAGRHLPLADALRISLQVCAAAGYAHRHDLVHRDIKPANIMIDIHGQAILMDFGIVKIVGGQYHTATGATIGTAIYMPPEQIRSERVDERSDIYSMGVMLFEMLSGRPPYEADSALTLMMMHLNDPVPNPRDLRPDVPPLLAAVVIKALAKDRSQRYQTAEEMASDLSQVEPSLLPLPAESPTIASTMAPPPAEVQPAADPVPTRLDAAPTVPGAGQIADLETRLEVAPPAPALPPEEPALLGETVLDRTTQNLAPAALAESAPVSTPVVALPLSSPVAAPAARRLPRWFLLVLGLVLLAVLLPTAVWFINQRKPPAIQLTPIERPAIPINLENQSRLVSLGVWQVDSFTQQLVFSPDSELLATASDRDFVRFSPYTYYAALYRVTPGELQAYLLDHTSWMKSLDFSPDGVLLATSADDEKVNFWQVATGDLLRTIHSEHGPIASLDFSPNGELLAGGVWSGVDLWQVSNGNLLRTYPAGETNLRSVVFSPDGKFLAGGSEAGEVLIWSVSDGVLLRTLTGHNALVNQLAFSPDGTRLASASDDKTLILWQVSDWAMLAVLTGHTEAVTGLAFSSDGSLLASTSYDASLRLWQASDGLALRAIQTEDSLTALVFSPDGAWLVAAGTDGRLRFWGMSEAISLLPSKAFIFLSDFIPVGILAPGGF